MIFYWFLLYQNYPGWFSLGTGVKTSKKVIPDGFRCRKNLDFFSRVAFPLLSCAPITGILHAAAVPDGNKKNHSMFYAVFVSDFCELNEIIPKPIRIL